eukprot:GSA25T00020488001.1
MAVLEKNDDTGADSVLPASAGMNFLSQERNTLEFDRNSLLERKKTYLPVVFSSSRIDLIFPRKQRTNRYVPHLLIEPATEAAR